MLLLPHPTPGCHSRNCPPYSSSPHSLLLIMLRLIVVIIIALIIAIICLIVLFLLLVQKKTHAVLFLLQQTESDLLAGYVEQCVRDDDYTKYPFRCTVPGRPGYYYRAGEALPGTNCIPPGGTRDPKNVSLR